MIPIIIATILLVLWIAGQWYFNDKKTPQSVANNPFRLPIGGRIIWLIVAWAVSFLIVPVAMIHAANPLRFFVLLAGGCMVMVGALPIHEDEDGIGGDLYNLFIQHWNNIVHTSPRGTLNAAADACLATVGRLLGRVHLPRERLAFVEAMDRNHSLCSTRNGISLVGLNQ